MQFTSEQLICIISALRIRKCNVEATAMKYISDREDRTDSLKVSLLNKQLLNDCDKELRMINSTLESANMALTSEQLICIISALKIRKCNVEITAMKYICEREDRTDSLKVSWLNKLLNDCEKEIRMINSTLESANIALASIGKEDKP